MSLLLAATAWVACSSFDEELPAATEDGGPETSADASLVDSPAAETDSPAVDAEASCADAGVVSGFGCPTPIAEGQPDPLHVLVANGRVFWTNFGNTSGFGNVMAAQLDGQGPTEFVARSNGYHPRFLAARGGFVYWGEQTSFDETNSPGAVHRQPAGGGSIEAFVSPYAPRGITVSATHAYWVTWNGQVIAHDLASGTNATWASGLVNPIDIDVDDSAVVVTQGGNATSNPGSILGFSLDGGGSAPSVVQQDFPSGLRVDGKAVYWANQGKPDGGAAGTINRTSRSGASGLTRLCQAQPFPQFVALDGDHVYFTSAGLGANDGELRRVPRGGGTCELLVSGLARPHGISVHPGYVYWTTRGDGRVWRMMLP